MLTKDEAVFDFSNLSRYTLIRHRLLMNGSYRTSRSYILELLPFLGQMFADSADPPFSQTPAHVGSPMTVAVYHLPGAQCLSIRQHITRNIGLFSLVDCDTQNTPLYPLLTQHNGGSHCSWPDWMDLSEHLHYLECYFHRWSGLSLDQSPAPLTSHSKTALVVCWYHSTAHVWRSLHSG